MSERLTCPCCGGEGITDTRTGWRWTGSGFGDCEETWLTEECVECDGMGEVDDDDEDEGEDVDTES